MHSGPRLRPSVLAARERIAEEREKLRSQHEAGSPGIQVCTRLTDLYDSVVLDLFASALADIHDTDPRGVQSEVALVPHGGFGRRDVAPYSDVDLMLLHAPGATQRVQPLAKQLSQDIVDSGLSLGFSVRTPAQACQLAWNDAKIFTSLAESRYLFGSVGLFTRFMSRFRRHSARRAKTLIESIRRSRREERSKYGDTVFLLKPNIKRSRGCLRDIQTLRWVGFARYGHNEPRHLYQSGLLSREDRTKIREAVEFFLRIRNEMHFHAGQSQDGLDRTEQKRLAEWTGSEGPEGVLPVEHFMRTFFEHSMNVRYAASHFVASAQGRSRAAKLLDPLLSVRVDRDFRITPASIGSTRAGLQTIGGDLEQVLQLMQLANWHDKRIDHRTWEAIRDSMSNLNDVPLTPKAIERFMSLLSQPARVGELLRKLHELRVLEKIIPPMRHARSLLQFNDYHKYTVDEHSIRAVERATEFLDDKGPLGDAYRGMTDKRILHLTLLMHDLGKGFPEDHSEVGMRLADETARHLHLSEHDRETLKLLVHKHLVMNHLALRRNIDDESIVLQFAIDVGTPDVLQKLYILSCADLAAVGPDVLNNWKLNLLTELYRRTMRHLAGEGPTMGSGEWLDQKRTKIRELIGDDSDKPREPGWWKRQIRDLPAGLLLNSPPEQLCDELRMLKRLAKNDALAWGRYLPRRQCIEYNVGTHESIAPGVVHLLTGALSSKAQQILGAEINTLSGGLVLDRFFVQDMEFPDEPSPERMDEISDALTLALKQPSDEPPHFRRFWRDNEATEVKHLPTKIHFDNNTSADYTIVDIFAHDRLGLLYTITSVLFDLGLQVHWAKIGTHLDQVVDVFYLTDREGRKIESASQIALLRQRLLAAIQQAETEQQELRTV